MIEISQMSYGIPNVGNILSSVNLKISEGDFVGVLGKNGAGKTTLIDLIVGFRRPSEGSVIVLGEDPFLSEREIFFEISYLSQDVTLKDNITVEKFLSFNKFFCKNYSNEDEKNLIDLFGLDLKAKIGGLSTGQKRRVQIVSSVSARPKILFIDEITAVLDPDARILFFDILKKLNSEHKTTIVLATNIVEDLKGRVDSVFFIKESEIEKFPEVEIENLFKGTGL